MRGLINSGFLGLYPHVYSSQAFLSDELEFSPGCKKFLVGLVWVVAPAGGSGLAGEIQTLGIKQFHGEKVNTMGMQRFRDLKTPNPQ